MAGITIGTKIEEMQANVSRTGKFSQTYSFCVQKIAMRDISFLRPKKCGMIARGSGRDCRTRPEQRLE